MQVCLLPLDPHDRPHFRVSQFQGFLLRGMRLRLIAKLKGRNTTAMIGANELMRGGGHYSISNIWRGAFVGRGYIPGAPRRWDLVCASRTRLAYNGREGYQDSILDIE
jgi:hypothetical protein